MKRIIWLAVSLGIVASSARAYVLEGPTWTKDRTVVMQLSLGAPRTLSDGFSSFNESARDALAIWNQYLVHLHFTTIANSPVTPRQGDEEMSVAFASTVFGDSFGADVLAVTLLNMRGNVMEETDTLFNTAISWDSYRVALRKGVEDFHRVAMHEFGHTIGLDHPDEHAQHVVALMNSTVSNVQTPQPDDIAGVQELYGAGPSYQTGNDGPVLLNVSTRAFSGSVDAVLIGGFIVQGSQPVSVIVRGIGYSLAAQGIATALSDPSVTVYDSDSKIVGTNDDWFTSPDSEIIASYHLDPANSIESALYLTLKPGSYTAIVQSFSNATQPASPGVALVEVYDLHQTPSRLGNISTRGMVGTGDTVLIGGFIIGGSDAKQVIVRALGPTLQNNGLSDFLPDPTLALYDASGTLVASNDNWQDGADARVIVAANLAPAHASEAALSATLSPGSYTAIVQGANNTTGIGLVEVYDMTPAPQ